MLNCKRFPYFPPFTHAVITQNTTHRNIMYLYRGHSASTSLGKGQGVDEKSNKKWHRKEVVQSKRWCPSHKYLYALFPVTESLFLPGIERTSKKEPPTVSEITIWYIHKNIIIPLLYQCELFIHTCVSKNSVVSKDVISTSADLIWYNEAAIYVKNLLFSHSIVS